MKIDYRGILEREKHDPYNYGWRAEEEPEALEMMQEFSSSLGEDRFLYEWDEVKDEIYDKAYRNIKEDIEEITQRNYEKKRSSITKIRRYNQIGNCCAAQSGTRGVASGLQRFAYLGSEIEAFDVYVPWIYGMYHTQLMKQPSSGGCNMGGIFTVLNRLGIVPADISDLPSYEQAIQKWNASMSTGNAAFEKYGNEAKKYQIKCAKIPANSKDVIACCKAEYPVCFGTSTRVSLSGEYYHAGGGWMHAMEFEAYRKREGDEIQLCNSHGENRNGWCTLDTINAIVNAKYFDAFVILGIKRTRTTKPNWSLFSMKENDIERMIHKC